MGGLFEKKQRLTKKSGGENLNSLMIECIRKKGTGRLFFPLKEKSFNQRGGTLMKKGAASKKKLIQVGRGGPFRGQEVWWSGAELAVRLERGGSRGKV